MEPGTFVATCAVVIAMLSLVVTIVQARVTQIHNRKSVRPVLQIGDTFHRGEQAGLLLSNVGPGAGEDRDQPASGGRPRARGVRRGLDQSDARRAGAAPPAGRRRSGPALSLPSTTSGSY